MWIVDGGDLECRQVEALAEHVNADHNAGVAGIDRLNRAERWFRRWGIWAVILGRHVPGFRITTTVVAAVFGVRLPTFLLGVAISAGAWLAIWMGVGVAVGPRAEQMIGAHRYGSLFVLAAALLLGALYVLVRRALRRREGA